MRVARRQFVRRVLRSPRENPAARTYYRLARGTVLPKHWAYGDPWEDRYDYDTDRVELIDNRAPGFQVWPDVVSVLSAALGEDRDGSYTADDYPTLLIVRATNVDDSVGEWYAVRPHNVTSVRALRTRTAVAIADRLLARSLGARWREHARTNWRHQWDVIHRALNYRRALVARELFAASRRVRPKYVETLPVPR
ncbi:MAG: hypothetical protein ACYDAR_22330 [Thermomicrobiales bacterium]